MDIQPDTTTPALATEVPAATDQPDGTVEPEQPTAERPARTGPRSRWLNVAAIVVLGVTATGVAFAVGRASTTWDVGTTTDGYAARRPGTGDTFDRHPASRHDSQGRGHSGLGPR